MPHAVLLEGGTAEGRLETAHTFCAAWLCESVGVPCGHCNHCRKALGGFHPDVTTLRDGEDGKQQIGVDAVRALQMHTSVKPGEAARRVFVIENAHKLTVQAQNALLKSIEEPPPAACFLLLCPSRKELLTTILSRVTSYALPGVAEDFGEEATEAATQIAQALAHNDEYGVLAATAPFDKNKPLLTEALGALKALLREGLIYDAGCAVENGELAQALAALGTARIATLIERVRGLEQDLTRNANLSLLRVRIPAVFFDTTLS